MLQNTPNRWLIGGRAGSPAAIRLFAFPYAGGGASVFRQWGRILPPGIDPYAVQLPGRETRFAEPALTQFPAVIEAIVNALRPNLEHPFAFFGHSMGGLLAFETTRYLRRLNAPLPLHLLISGNPAPQVREPREEYSKLPDAEFIQSIRKFGGMPDEVLQHTELLQLLLPTLRADFNLFETYDYVEEAALDCPITAFGGLDDTETPQEKLAAWNIHTTQAFRLSMFPGNHFYLNTAQNLLLAEIARTLGRYS
ncbi:MAG: alpha/beta fold hydrolase [Anaerolineales bacterium]